MDKTPQIAEEQLVITIDKGEIPCISDCLADYNELPSLHEIKQKRTYLLGTLSDPPYFQCQWLKTMRYQANRCVLHVIEVLICFDVFGVVLVFITVLSV